MTRVYFRGAIKGEEGTLFLNFGLANGQHKVVLQDGVRDVKGLSVHDLVLEDDDWVRVANGGLEETFGVLGRPGRDDLEAGTGAVPGGKALGVLGSDTCGSPVGSSKDARDLDGATGHVAGLGGRIDDVINRLVMIESFIFFFQKKNSKEKESLCTCMEKLKVMNSQMGLSPAKAAPTAMPAKPISVMGVSMTRFSPNLSRSPLETFSSHHLSLSLSFLYKYMYKF